MVISERETIAQYNLKKINAGCAYIFLLLSLRKENDDFCSYVREIVGLTFSSNLENPNHSHLGSSCFSGTLSSYLEDKSLTFRWYTLAVNSLSNHSL